jgi:predicted RNA binding protein YcfA (HicA-like mRNA interferase family)
MPRLRRLSGAEVIRILKQFDFEVIRIKGSHHILRRVVDGETQTINVPVHASQVLATGLLKRLYQTSVAISAKKNSIRTSIRVTDPSQARRE